MNKEYIINHFINSYYNNFELVDKDKSYNEYIDINESIDIVCSFLSDYDKDLLNNFLNLMSFNSECIKFVSNELSNNSSSLNSNNNIITINVKNNIEDVFSIVHEFIHYVDTSKGKNKENYIYSETSSITIELFLHKYLIDNKIHYLDSNNYIFNKLKNYFIDAIYVKYYSFKRNITGIDLINLLPKDKYKKFIEKEINKLNNPYKDLFLKYYNMFDKRIKNDSLMANYYIKRNYNYLLGLYLGTYLFNKNDKKLIYDINKASYNDDLIVPTFDIKEVSKLFDNYINNFFDMNSKLNDSLEIYNISNFGELMYRIISNVPDDFNIDNLYTEYYISLNESVNIIEEFFKWYDINIYNSFVNIMHFDKYSVEFKYNENKYINNESCMYLEDGRIHIDYCNDASDMVDLVHEFGHKIDYSYCDNNHDNALNFTEVLPITLELYLCKFLNYSDYSRDIKMVIYNEYNYLINKAYICYFIYYLMQTYDVSLFQIQYLNIDKNDFRSKMNRLPKNIQDNFILKFDEYIEFIKSKKDEIYDFLLYNIQYAYAILISPYLCKLDDKELINNINRTSYLLNDSVKNLDDNEIDKAFKKFINEFKNIDYDNKREFIK